MRSIKELWAAWRHRPRSYSRSVWALTLALDALPWPLGEELLAGGFVVRGLARRARWQQALAFASAWSEPGGERRRLARALCAYHGRFVARSAFIGMRDPDTVRQHVSARGEEHLAAAGPGVVLLGFHLGPAQSYLALRALGHDLTWVGGRGASAGWARAIRARFQDDSGDLYLAGTEYVWERRLYRARQLLLDAKTVFISGDGGDAGTLSVPIAGRSAVRLGTGWLFLRRSTKAIVLPVLSHLEGRVQVVTVHAPLPAPLPDPAEDTDAALAALAPLLEAYVRRYPEQCYSLAFGLPPDEPRRRR